MLTHRNLVANLMQVDAMETTDIRALAGVLPFFHIYGMVVVMGFGLMRGATIVTLPRFRAGVFFARAPGVAHSPSSTSYLPWRWRLPSIPLWTVTTYPA